MIIIIFLIYFFFQMNYSIITEFIRKCLVLNIFGSILNFNMSAQDIENIYSFIRMNNYSLTIY